ncbi:MAG: hypothetical protein WD059_09725 [Balneolaceae bacterium]
MTLTKINSSNILITVMCIVALGFSADHESTNKTVTGPLSGFDCAVVGELCPTTHRGADYTTGIFTEDKDFFFVVNIPQSFLQQYFRETIEVEGTVYDTYSHAIEPESIYLINGDERRLVYEGGYFIDENEQRATFQDGVYRNGRWNIP